MRERPSSRVRQSQPAADIPFQQKDCNTGPMSSRDSSPMFQVRLPCDAVSDDNSRIYTLEIHCRLLPYQLTCPKLKSLEPRCPLEAPGGTLISRFAQRHCRRSRPHTSPGPAQASAWYLFACAGEMQINSDFCLSLAAGSPIARIGSVGSVKSNLATPPGIAATGRLRDAAAARRFVLCAAE